jgi:predicted small secreted protein
MRKGIETRLDGSILVVRIPMRFQRRGGCKRIVAPDGSEIVPTSKTAAGRNTGQGAGQDVAMAADAGRRPVRFCPRAGVSGTRQPVLYQLNTSPGPARAGRRRTDLGRLPGTTVGGAHAAVPGRVGAAADPGLLSSNPS